MKRSKEKEKEKEKEKKSTTSTQRQRKCKLATRTSDLALSSLPKSNLRIRKPSIKLWGPTEAVCGGSVQFPI